MDLDPLEPFEKIRQQIAFIAVATAIAVALGLFVIASMLTHPII